MGCGASSGQTVPPVNEDMAKGPGGKPSVAAAAPTPDATDSASARADLVRPEGATNTELLHMYCGNPKAKNVLPGILGSDPHQAGWLAGKWTASSDDSERVEALRKLGILLTVRARQLAA